MLIENTQTHRFLQVDIPACKQELILAKLTGNEHISQLFQFDLTIVSSLINNFHEEELIGANISFQINSNEQTKYFNGIIKSINTNFATLHKKKVHEIKVVPWIWLLSKKTNCRIFQNKTVTEIIAIIFQEYGYKNYDFSKVESIGSYYKQNYCVQYKETTFNFISRIMEESGIFYYFEHSKNAHKLVMSDDSHLCKKYDDKIIFNNGSRAQQQLNSWEKQYTLQENRIAQIDYNFKTPETNLLTQETNKNNMSHLCCELFNYPGNYKNIATGKILTKFLLEAHTARSYRIKGEGNYNYFSPGNIFNLKEHDCVTETGEYLLLSITHNAYDISQLHENTQTYQNSFIAIPANITFRPKRKTIKPVINGIQIAKVVGSTENKICIDEFGRIKVQFFWDRQGKHNDQSSCWIRVAQSWSGKKYGMMFHPHIGDEVLISFLEGDPDKPIIIGNLYNNENKPPYTLPINKTQGGIKTISTNEIRFEDKKNQEEIYIHAQKNFNKVIENNITTTIKHGDHKTQVNKGSSILEAQQKIELKVGGNAITIDANGIKINGLKVSINNDD